MAESIACIFIIHLLVYPSSNGYNSFMDRDTESIGGIEHPMQPTRQLYYTTVLMDISAVVLSMLVSAPFTLGIAIYIICSKLYSYRGIRLKRFPVVGYLVVILNQGALIFAIVYMVAGNCGVNDLPATGITSAAFLIGGFYPITQIYQHKADEKDAVKTLSMMLGKRGTFVFAQLCTRLLLVYFFFIFNPRTIYILLEFCKCFSCLLSYIFEMVLRVWRNENLADFKHTMRMNMLASTCTNLAFITLITIKQLG